MGIRINVGDLEIGSLVSAIQDETLSMDQSSKECKEIKKIIRVKGWTKEKFLKYIGKHLVNFSGGVLEDIITKFFGK